MSDSYRCHDCHMSFGTIQLLQKHKQKFCVGGSVGDPDSLLLRRGLRSADEPVGRSVSPDDRDYQRYNPNQDAQLRQLAENHGRQMEYLQLRNRDLEKQKEDIRRRLEELGSKGRPTGGDDQAALLAELRAQEERNQRALEELRRQLYDINHKRVNVIEVEKPSQQPQIVMQPPAPLPAPLPQPDTGRKSYIYPVYYGSSLVAEISAIRQAYLQNGGNDPDVLAQMSQMQAEAQAIEDQMKRDGYDNRHRDKKDKDQFRHLEMENERLHRELLLLQEQNFLARERKKSDREGRDLKHLHAKNSSELIKHRQKYTDNPDREFVWKVDQTTEIDKLDKFIKKYGEGGTSLFHSNKNLKPLKQLERDDAQMFEKKYKGKYTDIEKKHKNEFKHGDPQSKGDVKEKTSHPSKKPYVPPLDLRQITETEEDIYLERRKPRYHHHSPRDKSIRDNKVSPRHSLPYKGSTMYGYGKSKSYYDPHARKGSSKTDKSIRSEIMEGVIEPRQGGKKFQMVKGSLSENDLVGLFSSGRKGHKGDYGDLSLSRHDGKSGFNYNVKTIYSVPADRKLETISIKHRDEMNPNTQNVISTVTYKEEKFREKAKV